MDRSIPASRMAEANAYLHEVVLASEASQKADTIDSERSQKKHVNRCNEIDVGGMWEVNWEQQYDGSFYIP